MGILLHNRSLALLTATNLRSQLSVTTGNCQDLNHTLSHTVSQHLETISK